MEIKVLNRGEAQAAMEEWISSAPILPQIDSDYAVIRRELVDAFRKIQEEKTEESDSVSDYYVDVHFGIALHQCLSKCSVFSLRNASDDGFWRYLSVKVIPDIVSVRWGKNNESHFWSVPRRIWLKQLWWYVYLCWNNNIGETEKIMESPNCSTDTILNLVERSGRKGTDVDSYRKIMYYYTNIPIDVLRNFKRTRKSEDLFRIVMKLNTARMLVMEPSLCSGGCDGYVRQLFADAGVEINAA